MSFWGKAEYLPPGYKEQLLELVQLKVARKTLRLKESDRPSIDFRSFVSKVNPRYRWYRHCDVLADSLQKVADGKLKRLLIFMPPRHGKSEAVSRLFPAYFLYRYPEKWVGITSYASDLAHSLSRNARENYQRIGGLLNDEAKAVKHWETGIGGGVWAAGVGGPITGRGFSLGIIDDPLKNAEEAASETMRSKQRDWYSSTFYTREEPWSDTDPQSAIIVVQTRWHEDDLSGWLLSEEHEGDDPERWHIVNFPAIAEDSTPTIPATCTLETDWREAGEALCPERRPIEKLKSIKQRIGDYYFDALFQQRPSAKEGYFFKIGKLEIVEAAPAILRKCRAWDLAATASGGAFTSGAKIGVDATGVWYVLDVTRGQWAADEVRGCIRNTALIDGQDTRIHLPQDPGQAGKDQSQQLVRLLAGFTVRAEPVSGAKETRAFNFAAQVNAGNVKLLRGAWNKAFIEELRQFPRGKYMDQVDSIADAFNELATTADFEQGKWRR